MAALEKKLEVLSAALNWKEQGASEGTPGYMALVDQSPSGSTVSSEPSDRRESMDDVKDHMAASTEEAKGAMLALGSVPNTNGDSPHVAKTIMSDTTTPVHFRTPPSLYTASPRLNGGGPAGLNNGLNPHFLAQATRGSISSTPDQDLRQESMLPSGNKDIGEIREKMVQLWQLISKNSAIRLDNVENGPRMRTPTYETDIISRGVISGEEAEFRLSTYRNKMYSNYSLIEVPESVTAEMLRRESPLLFLAIMSISSVAMEGIEKHEACITIHNQAIDAIIYETMILGNKSLELLKCLILLNMWYNTPEMHHHQKSHLITHLCTTLAIDLGLGGTTYENHHASDGIKYDRILRPYLLLNPQTPECRKLWLCVYISSINISTIIKRPVFLMWSKYTEECCSVLEQPERSITERKVAALARLNHLHEEISLALQGTDSQSPPDVNDPRTRCLIRYFEHKLHQISGMVNLGSSVYSTALYLVQIYLHESAMYVPVSQQLGRAPYSEYSLAIGSMKVSIHTAQAIGWCYSGAVKCLEIIAAQSLDDLAVMPLFCYCRTVFSASTLLKLRTLYLTTPDFHQICTVKSSSLTPINTLMDKLEQVIERYPFANSAINFCFVLQVLICHFDRQLHYFFHPDENPNSQTRTTANNGHVTENMAGSRAGSDVSNLSKVSSQNKRGIYDTNEPCSQQTTPVLTLPQGNDNNNYGGTVNSMIGNGNSGNSNNVMPSNNNSSSNTPASNQGTANVYLRPLSPSAIDNRRYAELQPDSPLDILSSVAVDSSLQKRLDQEGGDDVEYLEDGGNGNINGDFKRQGLNNVNGLNPNGGSIPNGLLPGGLGTQANTPKSGFASLPLSRRLSSVYGNNNDQQGGGLGTGEYPSWLVTDDFWKELVPGAEALSGFDMY